MYGGDFVRSTLDARDSSLRSMARPSIVRHIPWLQHGNSSPKGRRMPDNDKRVNLTALFGTRSRVLNNLVRLVLSIRAFGLLSSLKQAADRLIRRIRDPNPTSSQGIGPQIEALSECSWPERLSDVTITDRLFCPVGLVLPRFTVMGNDDPGYSALGIKFPLYHSI